MLAAYCGGMTYREIGVAFGRSEETVRRVLQKMNAEEEREKFRERLKKDALNKQRWDINKYLGKIREILDQLIAEYDADRAAGRGTGIPHDQRVDKIVGLVREMGRIMGPEAPGVLINVQGQAAILSPVEMARLAEVRDQLKLPKPEEDEE